MPRYRAVIAIQYIGPIAPFVQRDRVIRLAPGLSAIRKRSRLQIDLAQGATLRRLPALT